MNANYLQDDRFPVHVYDSVGNADTPELRELLACGADGSVRPYDEHTGYYKLKNPGWIVFDLGREVEIGYIRLLLWDNCGGEKKQPSRRRYIYRLLTAAEQPGCDDSHLTWTVRYYNMNNGSNGWQEFVFAPVQRIRYIKLHTIANTRDAYTHLVNIQAYEWQTRELQDYFDLSRSVIARRQTRVHDVYVPSVKGLVCNRVIIEKNNRQIDSEISTYIYKEISAKIADLLKLLRQHAVDTSQIDAIRGEVEMDAAGQQSVESEFRYFHKTLLKPIFEELHRQKKNKKWANWALVVAVISYLWSLGDLFLDFWSR